MRYLLLLVIQIYWRIIPPGERRSCIFRCSCSTFVYNIAKEQGFGPGMRALSYRIKNCNSHHYLFNDPITGRRKMVVACGDVLDELAISAACLER
jgi:uncharacterized protein